jgi:hypothetical protein
MVIRALHDPFRHRGVAVKGCARFGPEVENAAATAVETAVIVLRAGLVAAPCQTEPSAFFTLAGVIGDSRSRTPVSRATALATAGATNTTDICPTPVG